MPTEPRAGLQVTTVRSLDEVETLRSTWNELQGTSLTTDIDYYRTIARLHHEVVRPHVLLVERDGVPVTLVVGHLHEGPVPHRVGPWAAYEPTLRSVNVVYRGIVGDHSPEVLDVVLRTFRRALDEREADAVLLRYLDPRDAIHEAARAALPGRRREHFLPRRPHWSATIGSSLEETLGNRSAKTRENVRRISRRLTQELGDRLRVEVFHQTADAPRTFADIDAIASRTYQHRSGSIFRDSELERGLALTGFEKGWYRAYVLYDGDSPIAFWTGFAYGGTFGWRGVTGYDPAYRRFSPGIYLLTRLLDDLSRDTSVATFDIGGGDVEYKRYFGDHRWEEVDIRLLGPGVRALAVNMIGSSVHTLHYGLRSVGAAGGAQGSATRIQRHRLKKRTLETQR